MPAVEELLLEAVAVAALARTHGNHPFGALLVFAAGSRPTSVSGPFDLPEARAVHTGFWTPA